MNLVVTKQPGKADQVNIRREKGKIWSHIRKMWLVETPEETVRQEYLCVLVNEYGFRPDQMDEEAELTGRGSGHARADLVIWRTAKDKSDSKNPLIIVECKSDNVTIKPEDYGQGDNYARMTGARFFVTHNSRETKYWRVLHEKMPKSLEEIGNVPHADASDEEIEDLISKLKTFKEDEFADLLHQCHNVIRNREKLDPAAAFDEIAKILFGKVYVERELRAKRQRKNLFSVDYLDGQLGKHPLNTLFEQTKVSLGFAVWFLALVFGLIRLGPGSHSDFVWFGSYFGFTAISMFVLALRLHGFGGPSGLLEVSPSLDPADTRRQQAIDRDSPSDPFALMSES
jgi:type I restriction enzyme M protein